MHGYVRSSPRFFRLIKAALVLFIGLLLLLAAVIPAPLQEAADPGRAPNPIRSAWFLLWIQELVSYSTSAIYLVLLLGVGFLCLPWIPQTTCTGTAEWLQRQQTRQNGAAVAAFVAIVVLTLVATFFRGQNWAFIAPF